MLRIISENSYNKTRITRFIKFAEEQQNIIKMKLKDQNTSELTMILS